MSRMVLLRMTRSFYGREDHGLTEKLLAKREGILLWAIEGWRRLPANAVGSFNLIAASNRWAKCLTWPAPSRCSSATAARSTRLRRLSSQTCLGRGSDGAAFRGGRSSRAPSNRSRADLLAAEPDVRRKQIRRGTIEREFMRELV